MSKCGICGRDLKKNTKVVLIAKDRWTGKVSSNPEDVVICEASCLTNALEIIESIMSRDKEIEEKECD